MNRMIRAMVVVCLLALAAPADAQVYYFPGGNFIVEAEPWRKSTDGPYYPADNPPPGVILYGPRHYLSNGQMVPENDVPTAYYYEPPRRRDWRQHDLQHWNSHNGGARP